MTVREPEVYPLEAHVAFAAEEGIDVKSEAANTEEAKNKNAFLRVRRRDFLFNNLFPRANAEHIY